MDQRSFTELVDGIKKYFGMKPVLDNQQMRDWFDECKHIPTEVIPSIKKHIHDQDSIPRNLPKAIKESWRIWKNENHSRIVSEKIECAFCGGSGAILTTKHDPELGRDYRYACRCGECENWRNDFGLNVPIYNAGQLMAMGYVLVD